MLLWTTEMEGKGGERRPKIVNEGASTAREVRWWRRLGAVGDQEFETWKLFEFRWYGSVTCGCRHARNVSLTVWFRDPHSI